MTNLVSLTIPFEQVTQQSILALANIFPKLPYLTSCQLEVTTGQVAYDLSAFVLDSPEHLQNKPCYYYTYLVNALRKCRSLKRLEFSQRHL